MKSAAVLTLLSLLSLGHSAPVHNENNCDALTKQIQISKEEILGKWFYISGSSSIPGSRSIGHLVTGMSVELTATAQDNILNVFQTQAIVGYCSTWNYNVTFENSTMTIEQPFRLKEIYLTTDCPDCLVVFEDIFHGEDIFTSFMLFSKSKSVSPAVVEMFKRQAACLKVAPPITVDPKNEFCPHSSSHLDGLNAVNVFFEAKLQLRVARLLDDFFDMFVN